jgi:nucleotide-binding universal stress UspA family protein
MASWSPPAGKAKGMYTRIVVTLDGSDLAEQVLPHVEALAEKFGSTVILVRATTLPGMLIAGTAAGAAPMAAGVVDPTPLVETERLQTAAYLAQVADRLRARGLAVEHEQPEGPAGKIIVEQAKHLGADLIAMTTHGRGGLERLVLGSVADHVVRTAGCPVLLVRATEGQSGQTPDNGSGPVQ